MYRPKMEWWKDLSLHYNLYEDPMLILLWKQEKYRLHHHVLLLQLSAKIVQFLPNWTFLMTYIHVHLVRNHWFLITQQILYTYLISRGEDIGSLWWYGFYCVIFLVIFIYTLHRQFLLQYQSIIYFLHMIY